MAQTWDQVPGFFDFEPVYDAAVAAAASGAVFVEVGCLAGRSTCYLGSRIRSSGKEIVLYAIDPATGSPSDSTGQVLAPAVGGSFAGVLHRNLRGCGLEAIVVPILTTSVQAARLFPDESIDFCFIDADHRYANVTADLAAWWPKVRHGGMLAGHDYRQPATWLVALTAAVHDFFGVRDAAHPLMPSCWAMVKRRPRRDSHRDPTPDQTQDTEATITTKDFTTDHSDQHGSGGGLGNGDAARMDVMKSDRRHRRRPSLRSVSAREFTVHAGRSGHRSDARPVSSPADSPLRLGRLVGRFLQRRRGGHARSARHPARLRPLYAEFFRDVRVQPGPPFGGGDGPPRRSRNDRSRSTRRVGRDHRPVAWGARVGAAGPGDPLGRHQSGPDPGAEPRLPTADRLKPGLQPRPPIRETPAPADQATCFFFVATSSAI